MSDVICHSRENGNLIEKQDSRLRGNDRKVFSRKYWMVFFFAVLVGLLMISSQLMFRVWMGNRYRGIAPIISPVSQDAAWYHAVMAEAMRGGKPWNAVLLETKHRPYPIPDLAERIMALPGRWFHAGADNVLLGWRFVLPTLFLLVVYSVSWRLTRSRLFSLTSATAVVCLSYVVYGPLNAFSILFGRTPPLLYTLYDRPVHPQFEAPFLWALFYVWIRVFEQPDKKKYWLSAGLIIGLLMYTYVWAWTWSLALLFALIVQSMQARQPRVFIALLKSGGVGMALGLPALISVISASHDAGYALRLAAVFGHQFASWTYNVPLILALGALYAARRFVSAHIYRLSVAGLMATFIAVNQQIVTGISLQPDHYMSMIGSSLVLWIFLCVGWSGMKSSHPRIAAVIVLLLSLTVQMLFQYRIFTSNRVFMANLQLFSGVATWLNEHATRDDVVFSNQNIGLLIPIYTPAHLWWHFYAMATPIDPKRIEQAAFTWFELLDLTSTAVRQAFGRDPIGMTQYFTLSIFAEQRLEFVQNELPGALARYEQFREHISPRDALRSYRVDYVLFDKLEDHWDPARLGVGEKVFENERFTLYSLKSLSVPSS